MILAINQYCLLLFDRVGVNVANVKNVIIWGNHSSTQFPDVRHAVVEKDGASTPVYTAINDDKWLQGDFLTVSKFFFQYMFKKHFSKINSYASLKFFVDHSKKRSCCYCCKKNVFCNVSC